MGRDGQLDPRQGDLVSSNLDVMGAAALAVLVLMVIAWLVSLPLRNSSIVDVVWGIGFVIVAWVSTATGDGDTSRSDLLTAMVTVWGARLSIHIWWRHRGSGESPRHQAMRKRLGERFATRSLGSVFILRGVLLWTVSLPLQLAMAQEPPALGGLAVVGVVIWGIGFFFGSVADTQLTRFRSDADNDGRILDAGLWRYTRHPNHFGDFCVWWGIFLVAAETSAARYAVVGPLLMTIILMKLPGMGPAERSLAKRMAGYADYATRTSAFFPRPTRTSP